MGLKVLQVKCENINTPWSGWEDLSVPLPLYIFPKLWCSEGQREVGEDWSNDRSSALFKSYMLNFKEYKNNWMMVDLYFSSMMQGGGGEAGGREMIQMRTTSSIPRTTTNKKTQVFFFSFPEPFCSYQLLLFAPLWVQTFGKLWYYFTAAVKVSFLNIQMWKAIFGWFVNVGLWDMQSESQAFCNGFLVHSAWPLKPFLTRQLVQNKWYAGLQAVTFLSPSQLAGCGLRVIFCPYAYSQPLTMSCAFGSQGERHPGLLSPAFHHLHVPGKMPFLYHCWVLWPHQHRSARKC